MPSRRSLSYAAHALSGAALAAAALIFLPDYLRLMVAAGDWFSGVHSPSAFALVASAFTP
jgi:hypothetical protein